MYVGYTKDTLELSCLEDKVACAYTSKLLVKKLKW